ncbi:hypothetical protein [Deinococcus sp. 6GRE01]|nr:hypothetical protein [Deinococcus sp. 6GRE01]
MGHAFQVLMSTEILSLSLLPDPPLPRALLYGCAAVVLARVLERRRA